MTSVFKNIFICQRGCNNNDIVNIIKNKYNCWFSEKKPFQYSNHYDKILLFYDKNISDTDSLSEVNEFKYEDYKLDGIIKLYCDDKEVKIFYIDFYSTKSFNKHCSTFRNYFIETIKFYKNINNINNIDEINITMHWEKKIINKRIEKILKEHKLLSDTENMTYIFKENDIPSSFTPLNKTTSLPCFTTFNNTPLNTMTTLPSFTPLNTTTTLPSFTPFPSFTPTITSSSSSFTPFPSFTPLNKTTSLPCFTPFPSFTPTTFNKTTTLSSFTPINYLSPYPTLNKTTTSTTPLNNKPKYPSSFSEYNNYFCN